MNSDLVKKRIDAGTEKYLTAKSLMMVSSGRPGLNVRYQFGTARKAEVEKYPAGWYGTVPPIHIIVKGGHVTLEGVVANQRHKDLVNIRANSVPGVFSVTNNLRVEAGY